MSTPDWREIQKEADIVDLHIHPSMQQQLFRRNLNVRFFINRTFHGSPFAVRASFPRLKDGGYDVILSVIHVPEKGLRKDFPILNIFRVLRPDLWRKLIASQPDNANALNALGYSYLERNVRIEEGMQLVEKAYQLAPNDAAIMDSMGWGHYRQGRLEKSLEFLRRAYAANPDPEIAAHLGEALWVHGDKNEAKKVWSGALKQNPQSEPLLAVMKKFQQK